MSKMWWKLCVLIGVWWLIFPSEMMAQADRFPTVSEYHLEQGVNTPPGFLISNDAHFIYQPGIDSHFIWDITQSQYNTSFFASMAQRPAGWSTDGRYFAVASGGNLPCQSENGSYLKVFDTETDSIEGFCIPLEILPLRLLWSPFAENIIVANEEYVIDLTDQTITESDRAPVPINDVYDYPGHTHYQWLWSPETQMPDSVIELRVELSTDQTVPIVIDRAGFYVCQSSVSGLADCQSIVDITGNYPGNYVFDWQISSNNLLLWGTHENGSPEAIHMLGIPPSNQVDTVFRITDPDTGETREIFRLSELGIADTFTNDFDWSPDTNTIALALEKSTGAFSAERMGVLILSLDWGNGRE